jgi:hypothetical protein
MCLTFSGFGLRDSNRLVLKIACVALTNSFRLRFPCSAFERPDRKPKVAQTTSETYQNFQTTLSWIT